MSKPEFEDFYRRIGGDNLAALWERPAVAEPTSPAVPAIWHYDAIRPHLLESGTLISKEEAHRRVLVLENPGLRGEWRITRSLYAGLQLIFPGEVAPNHRHSQTALRFIVEGAGAYTAVHGERVTMHPGDLILTPSWDWHDHGHDGDGPMVWLDILDSPLVAFLDAEFREHPNEAQQVLTRPEGYSAARYGGAMMPMEGAPDGPASPVLAYPYARGRASLEAMRRAGEPDPCHGYKLEHIDPSTGGAALPTIGTCLQLLPSGFETAPYRSTDSTVFCVAEGSGRTAVGDTTLDWRKGDVFVVPSWHRHVHLAAEDAVLFSGSDRPVQRALGLWREDRGGATPGPGVRS